MAGAVAAACAAPAVGAETGGTRDVVIYVSCHPDDLAGSIGTVLRLKERYDMQVIEFTHGERGLGEKGYRDGSTRRTRTAEDEAVCRALGVPLHWCEAIDGEAFADRVECERIAETYRRLRPRAIIVHWPVDTHYDHMMSAAAAIKATQLAGIRPEIYFQEQDIQSRGFQTAYHVDITPYVEKKAELAKLYACQRGPKIAERKAESNRVYARNVGVGEMQNVEVIGVYHGTVRPGHSVFDGLEGVEQ